MIGEEPSSFARGTAPCSAQLTFDVESFAAMWGWAGSIADFLATADDVILDSLKQHNERLWQQRAAGSQIAAWHEELRVMRDALRAVVVAEPAAASSWSVVFEFELPLEGGRRPDVVVLAGGSLVVLEFKSTPLPTQAELDQVVAYVRDLTEYHQASHGVLAVPMLVLPNASPGFAALVDEVTVCGSEGLAAYLLDAELPGSINLDAWLDAPYEPLPSLIDAARRIFRHEPLPHVRRALAVGIPETVEFLGSVADAAAQAGERVLAFVGGVPGAGKTLVGLRLVYERSELHGHATFLSGNGPLVTVLQDALKSRAFVRDIHSFIRTNALASRPRTPLEHVIVFDEAQRAWDSDQMELKRGTSSSEPDLLVQIGERVERWVTLVGLIGDGQEIHVGEESGIGQWHSAVRPPNATADWRVYCPPRLADHFSDVRLATDERLDLTTTLRSRRAEHLHHWVALLLEGSLTLANQQASRLADGFFVYVTRSLDDARTYARSLLGEAPLARYGLVASSSARNLAKYGVDNGFMATSRMNVAKWYNAPTDDPLSCCALAQPVTEFGCQGLELDLPIVCWGDDFRRQHDDWKLRPPRRKVPQRDPHQLLRNAYRVLLTRGRDGMVIWIPADSELDATEHALLASGVRLLPTPADLAARLA